MSGSEAERITVHGGPWQVVHGTLWERLVPRSGLAPTVQGEVIRLTGKLAREILDNGGVNWDQQFTAMVDAVPEYIVRGVPLPEAELQEAAQIAQALDGGNGDKPEVYRLTELAVAWVRLNPTLIPLEPSPGYSI